MLILSCSSRPCTCTRVFVKYCRLNFTLDNLEVAAPAYSHFCEHLEQSQQQFASENVTMTFCRITSDIPHSNIQMELLAYIDVLKESTIPTHLSTLLKNIIAQKQVFQRAHIIY